MPPAIIAAGIGAVGAIGGAVLSSSSQKSAANQAAQAQQQATDSQLQLGRENIGFQQGIYNQNKALLTPFVQRGNDAGNSINALLGLGGQATPQAAPQSATQSGVQQNQIVAQQPLDGTRAFRTGGEPFPTGFDPGEPFIRQQQQNNAATNYAAPVDNTATAQPQAQAVNPQSAQDAFTNFANSAGMQFQLQQGTNALNNLYAGRGTLQSGAAMKGIQDYGQHTALNNYFMPYMGLLQSQQATGAQSGSAIAGVGSNFGNTVSSIYGGQQNAIGNGADALSNAALLKGQANAGLYNTIGSSLGGLASSFVSTQPGSIGAFPGGGYTPYGSRY